MEIEDIEQNFTDEAWELGDYIENDCLNCKRQRVCACSNGKHRCENCNWVQEDNEYCEALL